MTLLNPPNTTSSHNTNDHGQLEVPPISLLNWALLIVNRYEYVKAFEQPDVLLPNTWIVVRIDGRGFHK